MRVYTRTNKEAFGYEIWWLLLSFRGQY